MTATPVSTRTAYIAWVLVCLVWGTTYLGISIALESIPPFLMAAFRWLLAGTFMIAVFWLRDERLPGVREWPALLGLAVLMICLGNGAVVWAQQTVPSGLASVLVAMTPFWMVAIERVAGTSDRLTPRHVAGLLVGFGGILLLLWPELRLGQGSGFLAGVASIQLASIGWSVGSSVSKRRVARENVLVIAAFQMVFAGVCLLVVGVALGEWQHLAFTTRTLTAFAYLVIVGSLVGYTAYAIALKHLPVSTVSLYAYVNPVIAVALGTLVLNEPFTPRIALASAVVLVAVAIVRSRD